MNSFRTMFPVLGVIAVLAGCSGAESANTGSSANAISAQAASDQPAGEGRREGRRPHGGPGRGGPEMLVFAALHENIDLTSEQRTAIEALVENGRKAHGDAARPAPDKAKTAELAAAIRSGNVDASKLQPNREATNVVAMRQQHQAKAAQDLAKLHDTLTKEQRAALVDAISAKMANHERGPRPEGRPEGRPHAREGGPMGHLLAGLDLTQAQKDELKAKLEADRPTPPSEADRAAMKAAMDAKLQSFKADAFDANAFVAPPANAPKMGGPADHMAKQLSAVVSVLTPEQREKLAQKIEQGPPARR